MMPSTNQAADLTETIQGDGGRAQNSPHATRIACGSSHSLALLNNQMVLSWGRGEDGQLGHGDAEERPFPQPVAALCGREIDGVFCGAEYSLAISSTRQEVYSWGWGDFGRLGHGDIVDVFIPKQISGLSGVGIITVSCGDTHTLALSSSGQVYSFGRNQNGQLGNGTDEDSLEPSVVETLREVKVVSIACGAEHSVVSTDKGQVFSWGWGRYGNLGLGDKSDRWSPTLVQGPSKKRIERVACGWRHSVLIDDTGQLWMFGWNRYGQLGIGTNTDVTTPVLLEKLKGHSVKLVTCGWRHTVVADENGQLHLWGWNKFGQLGNGSVEDANVPVAIEGLPLADPIIHISAGWRHNIAISQSGQVFSWGRGCNGQLGGSTAPRDVHVPTLMTELSAATIQFPALSTSEAELQQGSSYIPFADRYAVVPDQSKLEATRGKSIEAEPSGKRHCS